MTETSAQIILAALQSQHASISSPQLHRRSALRGKSSLRRRLPLSNSHRISIASKTLDSSALISKPLLWSHRRQGRNLTRPFRPRSALQRRHSPTQRRPVRRKRLAGLFARTVKSSRSTSPSSDASAKGQVSSGGSFELGNGGADLNVPIESLTASPSLASTANSYRPYLTERCIGILEAMDHRRQPAFASRIPQSDGAATEAQDGPRREAKAQDLIKWHCIVEDIEDDQDVYFVPKSGLALSLDSLLPPPQALPTSPRRQTLIRIRSMARTASPNCSHYGWPSPRTNRPFWIPTPAQSVPVPPMPPPRRPAAALRVQEDTIPPSSAAVVFEEVDISDLQSEAEQPASTMTSLDPHLSPFSMGDTWPQSLWSRSMSTDSQLSSHAGLVAKAVRHRAPTFADDDDSLDQSTATRMMESSTQVTDSQTVLSPLRSPLLSAQDVSRRLDSPSMDASASTVAIAFDSCELSTPSVYASSDHDGPFCSGFGSSFCSSSEDGEQAAGDMDPAFRESWDFEAQSTGSVQDLPRINDAMGDSITSPIAPTEDGPHASPELLNGLGISIEPDSYKANDDDATTPVAKVFQPRPFRLATTASASEGLSQQLERRSTRQSSTMRLPKTPLPISSSLPVVSLHSQLGSEPPAKARKLSPFLLKPRPTSFDRLAADCYPPVRNEGLEGPRKDANQIRDHLEKIRNLSGHRLRYITGAAI